MDISEQEREELIYTSQTPGWQVFQKLQKKFFNELDELVDGGLKADVTSILEREQLIGARRYIKLFQKEVTTKINN